MNRDTLHAIPFPNLGKNLIAIGGAAGSGTAVAEEQDRVGGKVIVWILRPGNGEAIGLLQSIVDVGGTHRDELIQPLPGLFFCSSRWLSGATLPKSGRCHCMR